MLHKWFGGALSEPLLPLLYLQHCEVQQSVGQQLDEQHADEGVPADAMVAVINAKTNTKRAETFFIQTSPIKVFEKWNGRSEKKIFLNTKDVVLIQQVLRRTSQPLHQSPVGKCRIGLNRTDSVNRQRNPIQWWMVVLGGLNKVSIDALRIRRTLSRFRAATVIRFVADVARGMPLGSGANYRAQDRRDEYRD
jgi:hypothetical protein